MPNSFQEEQRELAYRAWHKKVQAIFLDPTGTFGKWLAVVVRWPTGVVYITQCGGVATDERFVEGYLVPLGGSKFDVDAGRIDTAPLRHVFHSGDYCQWDWVGRKLPADRMDRLRDLVIEIPYWQRVAGGEDEQYPLSIDEERIDEIAEAWIPVRTPDGAGVLLYDNCD